MENFHRPILKGFLALLCLFPLSNESSAQEEGESSSEEEEKKELPSPWIGARFRWAEFEGSPYLNSVDLLYKPFVSDRFFLNYHIGLGKAWGDAFHVSSTAGMATGANLISNLADDSSSTAKALRVLGIISVFVPEGVGYYTVLDERFSIAPYLNVLSYDYRKNSDRNIEAFYVSMEAGIEGHFHLSKKWNLGVHIAAKPPYLYNRKKEDLSLGWDAGVSLHYRR